MPPKIITQYDYENFEKPGVDFKGTKSLTVQSDMDAADINKIMARFDKTQDITIIAGIDRKPMFGDFTQFRDYHSQLSAVKNAERLFLALPAALRNRFENDVEKFIAFGDDPKNKGELIQMGLLDPDPVLYVNKDGNPVNADGTKSDRPLQQGEKPWPLADGVQPVNPVA